MKKRDVLDKTISNNVKTIAILLMFCLHFFHTSWIDEKNMISSVFSIGSVSIEGVIADSGVLCVALFAIISGYGLFYSLKKNMSWKSCLKRILILYLDFWVVLLCVFIPIFFSLQKDLTAKGWILNMLGVRNSLNMFDWYVPFYAVAIVVLLIYVKYIESHRILSKVWWCGVVIGWGGTIFLKETLSLKYVAYIIVMLVGYLCAKYEIFNEAYYFINRYVKRKVVERILGIFLMLFVILWRYFISTITRWSITNQFDWLLAILFVIGVICTFNSLPEKVEKYCEFGGELSTNMWYLHAIFFGVYINLQWIAYWPKISILIILWVYALLIPFSWGLMKVQACVKRVIRVK